MIIIFVVYYCTTVINSCLSQVIIYADHSILFLCHCTFANSENALLDNILVGSYFVIIICDFFFY